MKKYLIAVPLIITAISVKAQTNFGIHGGGILSQVTVSGDEDLEDLIGNKKFKPGFKIGFFAEAPLTDNLYLNPELNYVYKGGVYKNHISNSAGSGDIKFTMTTNYLELPVNLLYKIRPSGGFYFGGGPAIGMGLSGEAKINAKGTDADGESINETESTTIKFDGKKEADVSGSDNDLHLKRFELGLNAFAGYEMQNGVRLQLQFRPNFTNLSPEREGKYKNTYLGLSVGYRF